MVGTCRQGDQQQLKICGPLDVLDRNSTSTPTTPTDLKSMSQTDKGLLTAAMQTGQAVSLGAQAMAKGVSAADSAKIVDSIRSLPPADFARESKLINDAVGVVLASEADACASTKAGHDD